MEIWQFLILLNFYPQHDPEILLQGIHQREMKAYIHKRIVQEFPSNIIHNGQKQSSHNKTIKINFIFVQVNTT